MSLYDRVAALPAGNRALAAARLRRAVLNALYRAFRESSLESQAKLAKRLRVRRSAVNQVFRGDGNLRVNTLAEYLYEMGYELQVTLVRAGELRTAALENRLPVPAFGVTSAFASVLYTQRAEQAFSMIFTNTTPSAWGAVTIGAVSAEHPFGRIGAIWETGSFASAFLTFEPIDLSRDLIRSEIAP